MSELPPYLESVAKDIDLMIDRYFVNKVGDLNKASAHLLTAGGKRLRPAVVLLAADAVNQDRFSPALHSGTLPISSPRGTRLSSRQT